MSSRSRVNGASPKVLCSGGKDQGIVRGHVQPVSEIWWQAMDPHPPCPEVSSADSIMEQVGEGGGADNALIRLTC